MSGHDLSLLAQLEQKMSFLAQRQSVLARNIANASTPGFVPQDLRAGDFAAALAASGGGGLSVSNAMHLQPRGAAAGGVRPVRAPDSQSSPDGNAVVVEEQMLKVAETQIGYAEAAGLYRKMTSMWRTALGSARA